MCEVEHVARTITTSDKVYGNVWGWTCGQNYHHKWQGLWQCLRLNMWPELPPQVTRSMAMCEVEHVARTVTTSDKVYGNVWGYEARTHTTSDKVYGNV